MDSKRIASDRAAGCSPVMVIAVGVLALLLIVYALWLPPRQTADMVGCATAFLAHLAVAAGVLKQGTMEKRFAVRLGRSIIMGIYWLVSQSTVLVWRLFSFSSVRLLVGLELAFAVVAALLCYGFYLGERYYDE